MGGEFFSDSTERIYFSLARRGGGGGRKIAAEGGGKGERAEDAYKLFYELYGAEGCLGFTTRK